MSPFAATITRRRMSAGALASAAILGSGFRLRAQGAPLRVGLILPRSGFQSVLGQQCRRGADVAQKMLPELGYPPLELVDGDTESNVQTARSVAERLIEQGAQFLVGAFDSGQTAAIAQVAEQKGVPFLINIAAAPQITQQGYKFVFRNFTTGPQIVEDAFRLQKLIFTTAKTTPKRVVFLYANDTYGESVKSAVNALFPKADIPYELVAQIGYDPKARDLSVEITRAKAAQPDLVWAVSRFNDAILVTREMIKQRLDPMGLISTGSGYYERQYMDVLGKYGNYPISIIPWYDPSKPLSKKIAAELARGPAKINMDTSFCYTFEALLIAADVYRRAGSSDPQALVAALKSTDLNDNITMGDGVRFDESGQNPSPQNAALQNMDGEAPVVLPLSAAQAKLVFPAPNWNGHG